MTLPSPVALTFSCMSLARRKAPRAPATTEAYGNEAQMIELAVILLPERFRRLARLVRAPT